MPGKKSDPGTPAGPPAPVTEAEQGPPRSAAEGQPALPVIAHLSVQEREEIGKATRARVPRATHAGWAPAPDRPDPVDLLVGQAASRVPELVPIRYGRMLVSPFAFYRGAAVIMASDLATGPNTGLTVQLCGDAHISNFGGFATPERELILDVNDFDETLPGPWEWDLKRLAASIEIAGRERGFNAEGRQTLVRGAVDEYHRAMMEFAALDNLTMWHLQLDADGARARWGMEVKPRDTKDLRASFARAHERDNFRAFKKLTALVDGQPRIKAHPPLIVPVEDLLPEAEQRHFHDVIRVFIRRYRATLAPDRRHLVESYRYVHAARKVVGVGSVGTRTWLVLMLGRDDNDPLFLQVKEAQASVLEPYLGKSKTRKHGQRVVEGQLLMQSASDIFLGWERAPVGQDVEPHQFYIRQLWDWKIAPDIDVLPIRELLLYGKMCAWTLARAHARTGDRIAIAAYLGRNHTFDRALASFAIAYADQNEADYQALAAAAESGRITVERGI